MTDAVTAKLAEWEALVEGATPGEWAVNSETMCTDGGEYTVYGIVEVDSATVTYDGAPAFAHTEGMGQADAEFIAAARTAMPALLGFVEDVLTLIDEDHCPGGCEHDAIDAEVLGDRIKRALTERIGGEG